MKKRILIAIVGVLSVMAAGFGAVCITSVKDDDDVFFNANVDVLTEYEAVITCSSGICGKCFEEVTTWPFYKCNWTGMQQDYCDCNKVGWL